MVVEVMRVQTNPRRTSRAGTWFALARATPVALFIAALTQAGCALIARKPPPPPPPVTEVTPFSIGVPGGPWPGGWRVEAVPKLRKPTRYALVDNSGTTVVKAIAEDSASGLVHFLDIDPRHRPVLTWRWKITQPVEGADSTRRRAEDAPARVLVSFSGDKDSLPFSDRLFFNQVKALSGLDVPYATLEYAWGSGVPKETVLINSYTPRIRILLVESGPEPLEEWVTETRDVLDDFRRAFGEEPGRITAIAIFTDADATGGRAQSYYGDIAFLTRHEAELRAAGLKTD
jgi:hypothetical protein